MSSANARTSQQKIDPKSNVSDRNQDRSNSNAGEKIENKADEREANEEYEEGEKEARNEEETVIRNIPRKKVEALEKSLEEASKTVEKLQQQNQKLKQESDLLQRNYDGIMEKLGTPKKEEKPKSKSKKRREQEEQEKKKEKKKSGDPELDELNQEVERKNLEVTALSKEINTIKNKNDPQGNIEKVIDLENAVADRDREISKLSKEKKTLDAAKMEQEKMIHNLTSDKDFNKKIEDLKNENKEWKEKIKKQQKIMNENEVKYRKQVNYVTVLKAKLREVCSSIGASSSINKEKAVKYDQIRKSLEEDLKTQGEKYNKLKKNVKRESKGKGNEPEEIPEELKNEFSEENCRLIMDRIREFKIQLQNEEKAIAKESESYLIKIKELEFQKRDLLNKLKEKDLEANIAVSEFNKMKRINKTSFIQLDPLEKSTLRSSAELASKKPLAKQIVKTTSKRRTRREVAGNLESDSIIGFDDAELLLDNVDQKIVEVTIFHDDSKLKIYGIQAVYSLFGRTINGYCNMNYELKSVAKTTVLKIVEEDDYLRFVSGFYTDSIEYLKLETQRGLFITVGAISPKDKQKDFRLDIRKDERPIILYGGLDYKKNCTNSKELQLVYIGIELDNSFYNQSRAKRGLNKSADEIEEILASDDEAANIMTKRGLVQSRVVPFKSLNRNKL